jgi:tripartite-type tricarboxylate transporter receptor subunit TctC
MKNFATLTAHPMWQLSFAAAGAALFTVSCAAHAQGTYPDRPIRLIVPFPAGGINDTLARPVAERMRSLLGAIVIENRGGAGGVIGASAVARAEADGYTWLLGSAGTHIVGPLTVVPRPYDPARDFKAAGILAVSGLTINVHPSLPVKTLKELVAYAGARPRALSYASAGAGSATHLGAELFKSLIRAPGVLHVPYRGGAAALADLLGGHVPVAVLNVGAQLIELHRAGRIRILAVTTARRVAIVPEIPTAIEAGVRDMIALNFAGLFLPAATPGAIVDKVSAAARAVMADKSIIDLMTHAGMEISADDMPAKAQRFVEDEIARWTPVVKSLALKPN